MWFSLRKRVVIFASFVGFVLAIPFLAAGATVFLIGAAVLDGFEAWIRWTRS